MMNCQSCGHSAKEHSTKPFADADFYPNPRDFLRIGQLYKRLEAGE